MGITIFTPAQMPSDERKRSEAAVLSKLLRRVDDVRLGQVVNDCRHILNANWCGIMLIIGDTEHVIVSSGGQTGMRRRSTSLCSYVVFDPDHVFFVLNASNDERFAGNPLVEDGIVSFFAGAAIRDDNGYPIGGMCITDKRPRSTFSDEDASALRGFAKLVVETLS